MGERAYINSLESRAVGLMREGRLDEAESSFRAAMDRKASAGADAMSMNNLGTVHLRQNRIAEAMEEFEQALRIRERANTDSPSSRGSLELGMIQRNLATAKRLAASHGYSGKPVGSRGWAVARDMLHKLSRDELQLAARRLGVGVEGSDEQMAQGIRAAVGSGDVNDIVQREMIRATFDLLDLDGDGELTKVEVLKGLRSSDKIKKLLELPDKLFPDEGGKKSNKALVDRVFEQIDKDGGGTISCDEFEAYCLSKMSKDSALKAKGASAFQAAGEAHAARREELVHSQLVGSPPLLESRVLHTLEDYDELTRGLESNYRRKAELQREMERMGAELRSVDAEIERKEARVVELKRQLDGHRVGHNQVIHQLDARVRELDHAHARAQVQQGEGAASLSGRMGMGSGVAVVPGGQSAAAASPKPAPHQAASARAPQARVGVPGGRPR